MIVCELSRLPSPSEYPGLNEAQRTIVGHLEGPLLVIAGPGSGKTYSIVLRALNLLLLEKALPRQLVLCTFTEKAAFEMRDRLAAAARKVGYVGDLSELTVSTIHSFCNRVLGRTVTGPNSTATQLRDVGRTHAASLYLRTFRRDHPGN